MIATRSGGYSLLEALIVLAIFALMVAGLAPFFRLAVTLSERSAAFSRHAEDQRALQAVLASILARAVPPSASSTRSQDTLAAFEGSEDQIKFLAPLPRAMGGGLARYELSTRRDGSTVTLRLLWTALGASDPGDEIGLVTNLKSATFSYLVATSLLDGEAAWQAGPRETADHVRAVKLVLVPDRDPGASSELVIPLAIDRNVWCVFDPVALECRPGG